MREDDRHPRLALGSRPSPNYPDPRLSADGHVYGMPPRQSPMGQSWEEQFDQRGYPLQTSFASPPEHHWRMPSSSRNIEPLEAGQFMSSSRDAPRSFAPALSSSWAAAALSPSLGAPLIWGPKSPPVSLPPHRRDPSYSNGGDAVGGFTMSSHKSAPLAPLEQAYPDPPRARVACTFCRARKLRCDGSSPCRHCERRSMECVYAPTKAKGKGQSAQAAVKLGPSVSRRKSVEDANLASAKKAKIDHQPSNSGSLSSDGQDIPFISSNNDAAELEMTSGKSSNRNFDADSERQWQQLVRSKATQALAARSTGSDLAMIQNDNSHIPMQPVSMPGGWWENLLSVIGESRPFANKLVHLMIRRFIHSNAIFFGLLHAPTLLQTISREEGIKNADPALYISVLAVAACDLHRTISSEPMNADLRAADKNSRKLSLKLAEMAGNYINSSLATEGGLAPSVGQAASILALIQPDGSTEQKALVRIAENIVRVLKLDAVVSTREPLLESSSPDSPLYWSRPVTFESSKAEIKYESIVRLCWTGCSHRYRRLIALPDEDLSDDYLPEFIDNVRPMAFWEPSILPISLPSSFFHSQDLMRRSADLARIASKLSKTEQSCHMDQPGRPGSAAPALAAELLDALDSLEDAFVRHRPSKDDELQSILGRTLQLFCRLHVWARMLLWRKHRLWTTRRWQNPALVQEEFSLDAPPLNLPPTTEMWLTLVSNMCLALNKDLDSYVEGRTRPQTPVREVDSIIRHGLIAMVMVNATGRTDKILAPTDAAIAVLKRYLAVSKDNANFAQFDQYMEGKFQRLQRLRLDYVKARSSKQSTATID